MQEASLPLELGRTGQIDFAGRQQLMVETDCAILNHSNQVKLFSVLIELMCC